MILQRACGCALGDARPDVLDEVDHAVDIGLVREKPEEHHGATVRRRVRRARLVVVDVRRVGNDHRAGPGTCVEQALLVRSAAKVDAVGIPVGPQLLAPQLAPVGCGVESTDQVAAGARILPGEVVVDVVGVHDQGRRLLARRSLTQIAVAEERELQIDDVEPRGAQNPVQGVLHLRHRDPQPLEASGRDQRPELQQALREAVATIGVGDQLDLAAVRLHRETALLDVEFVVDQHHCGQVVAPGQFRHQAVHSGLSAKARRAGRHLGNAENIEALWGHRSGSGRGHGAVACC